jgi:hypothetical protein
MYHICTCTVLNNVNLFRLQFHTFEDGCKMNELPCSATIQGRRVLSKTRNSLACRTDTTNLRSMMSSALWTHPKPEKLEVHPAKTILPGGACFSRCLLSFPSLVHLTLDSHLTWSSTVTTTISWLKTVDAHHTAYWVDWDWLPTLPPTLSPTLFALQMEASFLMQSW